MDKLNKSQVIDIVNKMQIKNEEVISYMTEIYDIYSYGKTQEGYKKLSGEEEITSIQNIVQEVDETITKIKKGEIKEESFQAKIRDIKYSKTDADHLEFFDRLGYQGMSIDILKALEKHKIPSTALRGIKATEGAQSLSTSIPDVTVDLEFENIDGSIALVAMTIWKGGKKIFDFGNGRIVDKIDLDDEEGAVVEIYNVTESYRKSVNSELYERMKIKAYDIDIQKAKDKNGRIYYYDRNTGHRVEKKLWEMYNI